MQCVSGTDNFVLLKFFLKVCQLSDDKTISLPGVIVEGASY
jgi:hypothetical protein